MSRAVFLDRDGTINEEKNYLYKIEDFEFLPGTIEAMKLLQQAGYILVVITNQSGIARGYYTEHDFKILNDWMTDELSQNGITLSGVYYCPHHPNASVNEYRKICNCRKPQIGLFERAIEEHNIDISMSWAVGDKIRDCSICSQTGCKGILIGDNEKKEVIDMIKAGKESHIYYAEDLLEAAKLILEEN